MEIDDKDKQDVLSESTADRSARIRGSALVALGFVLLLFAVAALVFFAIASLMQGNWLMVAVMVVIIAALVWVLGRLVRVAANQNKVS